MTFTTGLIVYACYQVIGHIVRITYLQPLSYKKMAKEEEEFSEFVKKEGLFQGPYSEDELTFTDEDKAAEKKLHTIAARKQWVLWVFLPMVPNYYFI